MMKSIPLASGRADAVLSELPYLREDRWDRCVTVPGFWVCRTIEWWPWNVETTDDS